jgi:hypothetical protein
LSFVFYVKGLWHSKSTSLDLVQRRSCVFAPSNKIIVIYTCNF